jgi:hypothetical protein
MKRSTFVVMAALSACSTVPVPQPDARNAQLTKQLEGMLTRLEQACVADPANAQTWERLSGALEVLGQEQRARAMAQQARSLREHDLAQDYALLARTEVRQVGAAMVEVRRIPADSEGEGLPASAATQVGLPARLEISNGNGVRGMAAAWGRQLQGGQWQVVRLTNTRPFAVARTRLEYRDDQEPAAQALAQRLGGAVLTAGATGQADLRIVLGHDIKVAAQTALKKKPPAEGGRQAP